MSKKNICGYNIFTEKCEKGIKENSKKCKLNKINRCVLKDPYEKKLKYDLNLTKTNKNLIHKIDIEKKDLSLNKLDVLKKDIIKIVNGVWNKKNIEKRASFNSNEFDELFTLSSMKKNKKVLLIGTEYNGHSKDSRSIKNNKIKRKSKFKFALNNEDDKRPLTDTATDFNTSNFWQNKQSRLNFIYLVLFTYNTMLEEIYKKRIVVVNKKLFRINENNLTIMFKGGNTLRMVIKELIKNFESQTTKYVLNLIGDYIKIGDFDFEIISYGLTPKIVTKINNISYLVILRLRNYLINNNLFDFFNYNNEMKKKKIEILKKGLEKTLKKIDKTNWFHGISLDFINVEDVIYSSNPYLQNKSLNVLNKKYKYRDEEEGMDDFHSNTVKVSKRIDFAIIQDSKSKSMRNVITNNIVGLIKAKDMFTMMKLPKYCSDLTHESREKGYFLYCSHNSIVNIHNDVGHEFNISFELNRIKYNYVIYYRKKIDGKLYHFRDDIPGEILDLNHTYKEDRKKYKFEKPFNNNKYLTKYKFFDYNLDFTSYSLIGLLDDLEVIIFDEVNYQPWNELKYKKRLYRILILTFLMYFNKYKGESYKMKLKNIDEFVTNINNDKYDTKFKSRLLSNLQKKLRLVYSKRENNKTNFNRYKSTLSTILKSILKIFFNQYMKTRDQVLKIKNNNISSDTLNI